MNKEINIQKKRLEIARMEAKRDKWYEYIVEELEDKIFILEKLKKAFYKETLWQKIKKVFKF